MPSGYPDMNQDEIKILSDWIEQGGTLIAHNSSSGLIASEGGIGNVKLIQETFEESHSYNLKLMREIYSLSDEINIDAVENNRVNVSNIYPWEANENVLSSEDLERRDEWQSLFMPSGAMVAGRIDEEHWLTFGTNKTIPVLYSDYPVLMTNDRAEVAVRIGEIVDNEDIDLSTVINWSSIPSGDR